MASLEVCRVEDGDARFKAFGFGHPSSIRVFASVLMRCSPSLSFSLWIFVCMPPNSVCTQIRSAVETCLRPSVSVYVSSLLSVCLYLSLSVSVCLCLSVCLSVSVSVNLGKRKGYTRTHTCVCVCVCASLSIYGHALRGPPPPPPSMVYGPGCPPSCGMECGFPLPPVGWLWGFWGFGSS